MKAVINKETMKANLDNEAVKAIRFVYGVNTDLRISLNINKNELYKFIENNGIGIFGLTFIDIKSEPTSDKFDKYEKMMWNICEQIIK